MIQKVCSFFYYKIFGWRLGGDVPYDLDKYIFVVIPHTSNWDFVIGWLAIRASGLDVTIFIKDTFFVWPFKTICRFFGCAPVNRRASTNFVDSIARQYQERDKLAALITPEGTRKNQQQLKSGYYYLAQKAGVPLVVAGVDYATKTLTLLPPRMPLETFEQDTANLIAYAKTVTARNTDQTFPHE